MNMGHFVCPPTKVPYHWLNYPMDIFLQLEEDLPRERWAQAVPPETVPQGRQVEALPGGRWTYNPPPETIPPAPPMPPDPHYEEQYEDQLAKCSQDTERECSISRVTTDHAVQEVQEGGRAAGLQDTPEAMQGCLLHGAQYHQ